MRQRPLIALLAAVLLLAGPASATTVVKLSPQQVDDLAARILEGRCLEIRPGPASQDLPASTEYVFAVERVLKGDVPAGAALVVRQVGGPRAPEGALQVIGMPTYEVGARYRLALNSDSVLGLTSPVGLGQGVRLLEDATDAMPDTTSDTTPTTAPGRAPATTPGNGARP